MLAIKLRPIGKKKQISYRIIISPKRSKLGGKFVEDIGWYNPHTNKFLVNNERAKHWIDNGAQPTDTVYNILVNAKIVDGPKKKISMRSKKKEEVGAGVEKEQNNIEQEKTEVNIIEQKDAEEVKKDKKPEDIKNNVEENINDAQNKVVETPKEDGTNNDVVEENEQKKEKITEEENKEVAEENFIDKEKKE